MRKLSSTILATLLLFACSQETVQRPTTPLFVDTSSSGEVRFNVEVAKTPLELQQGLMHRTEMASNNGMIFVFDPVRPVQMWMKNTKLSLDMLFVAANGKIVMIKEKATPMSETRITCKEPVRAVVELNAGQVKRHNIKVGDTVRHSVFDPYTTTSDRPMPKAIGNNGGPVIPKGPNAIGGPRPIGNPNGPVIPKGPNAIGGPRPIGDPNGPVIPKGPNAVGGPKPFGNPDGPVIPKGPNAVGGPKPFGDPNGPVIPKGPNAVAPQPQPIVPVVPPM